MGKIEQTIKPPDPRPEEAPRLREEVMALCRGICQQGRALRGSPEHLNTMSPAVDFLAPDWPERHNTGPNGPAFKLLGGDPRTDKAERARRASPLTYIVKDSPPFFIAHADKDATVPYSQGELLFNALKKAGVDATFYTVKGADHGGVHQADQTVIKEFFDKRLTSRSRADK